jgi:sulfite exporter TauE/SafE
MAVLGAGTIPAMVLAGAGGQLLSLAARRRLFQVAACCVGISRSFTEIVKF